MKILSQTKRLFINHVCFFTNIFFYDSVKFDNIWKQRFHPPAMIITANAGVTCPSDQLNRISRAVYTSVIPLFILIVVFRHHIDLIVNCFKLYTFFMKTYVLLHFEHKNDVTIIVKLLYRATSRRLYSPVNLWQIGVEPQTNCNSNYFLCIRLLMVSSLTYQGPMKSWTGKAVIFGIKDMCILTLIRFMKPEKVGCYETQFRCLWKAKLRG